MLAVAVGLTDDELGQVDDEPGEVTDEEHDHDADEDSGQVYFIVRGTVSVGPNMSIPGVGNGIKFQFYSI